MITSSSMRGQFIPSGFLLALVLRLLTSSLVILIPLFASDMLSVGASRVGVFVLILWLGNSVGVLVAVRAITRQFASSLVGFTFLAISTAGIALVSFELALMGFTFVAGIGMGLAQPFLSGLMHLDSRPHNPFEGLGLYSVALGLGLVAGPLLASFLLLLEGFKAAFLGLSLLSIAGVVTSIRNRGPEFDTSVQSRFSPFLSFKAFRSKCFTYSFFANLLYAFTLPAYLSFSAVYAETRFGFTGAEALIILSVVFAVSVVVRAVAVDLRSILNQLLLASAIFLLASLIVLGFPSSALLFVCGMLLFSVPHALVFPITNFFALKSVGRETVMNASYAFQWSSGVAEFVTPAVAVAVIPVIGLSGLFLAMTPFSLVALILVAFLFSMRHSLRE